MASFLEADKGAVEESRRDPLAPLSVKLEERCRPVEWWIAWLSLVLVWKRPRAARVAVSAAVAKKADMVGQKAPNKLAVLGGEAEEWRKTGEGMQEEGMSRLEVTSE
jgi:hypothetical protein